MKYQAPDFRQVNERRILTTHLTQTTPSTSRGYLACLLPASWNSSLSLVSWVSGLTLVATVVVVDDSAWSFGSGKRAIVRKNKCCLPHSAGASVWRKQAPAVLLHRLLQIPRVWLFWGKRRDQDPPTAHGKKESFY